jgi:hypothetical protein
MAYKKTSGEIIYFLSSLISVQLIFCQIYLQLDQKGSINLNIVIQFVSG